MERRSFLRRVLMTIGAGMLGSRASGAPSAASPERSLRIALLNDLHHADAGCDGWLRRVVEAVRAENPDFCVLAGDLADKGLESSLVSVKEHFGRLGCPVYPVPGNHDCDVPLDTSLYEQVFPGRLNYRVEQSGWQFLFLDTTEGAASKDTTISDRTLGWLRTAVKRMDAHTPTVVVSHFPLARPIHMSPVNADAVWRILRGIPVRGAFCGHFHGQHAVMVPPLVTTNVCCSRIRGNFDKDPRKGFWILNAGADGRLDYRLKAIAADAAP
jgi:3',5'-cyclic AMP phosphodiesterase CpdA